MATVSSHVSVVKIPPKERSWTRIGEELSKSIPEGHVPVRVIVVKADGDRLWFEASSIATQRKAVWGSLLKPNTSVGRRRARFVVGHIVPTGVRAEFGGFCGDGVPVTNLLAEAADLVLTNPNAITAADLYHAGPKVRCLEGNLFCHFLLGHLDLQDVPPREIAVLVGTPADQKFLDNTINCIEAMRTVAGLPISQVLVARKPFEITCVFSEYGQATGEFGDLDPCFAGIEKLAESAEAICIASELFMDDALRQRYYKQQDIPNPWGGAEAILTHTMTTFFPLPITHGPLLGDVANAMLGTRGDPRDTSELISSTYIGSVLKGLHRSPRPQPRTGGPSCDPGVISTEDLAAMVLPATAVGGLPFFLCLERGVPVILVEENRTAFGTSPADLGLADHPGIIRVKSYPEAAGVLLAMRSGIALDQIARPIAPLEAMYYG
jgi:hypothetical protein